MVKTAPVPMWKDILTDKFIWSYCFQLTLQYKWQTE